ncbi:CbtB domain-containing protein [Raoultella scottii]|uniref:CbtB domain-containing protein n=1 Tax=Raoultella scottii TaxID=3040937 RepID=UPI002FAD1EC2
MDHTVNDIQVKQAPIPLNAILPWITFITLLVMLSVYFIGAEQGATAVFSGNQVHEYFHDARHLLGFPCH